MAAENQPAISLKVTVGDLTVIASGEVNFSIKNPFRIHIENLTVEFVFEKNEDGTVNSERKIIQDGLVLQYIIRGKIPASPANYGLRLPANIATANGRAIWFTYGLTALGTDGKAVCIQYTVYEGDIQLPQKGQEKEASNV